MNQAYPYDLGNEPVDFRDFEAALDGGVKDTASRREPVRNAIGGATEIRPLVVCTW